MSVVVDLASWVLLAAGGIFCVIGAIGLIRMPDFYTRAHAASVIETLGAGLVLGGLILQAGWSLASVKILMLGLLMFFANPTATHAITRAAMLRGIKPVLADEGASPSKP